MTDTDKIIAHVCRKLYIQFSPTESCRDCGGYGINVGSDFPTIANINSLNYDGRKKAVSKIIQLNRNNYCGVCGGELPLHQDFCIVKE